MSARLKITLWIVLLVSRFGGTSGAGPYLPYTDGHMDIGARVVGGELRGYWKNDGATVDGQTTYVDYAADGLRALGIFDDDTPPLLRPAGAQWDFFGVAAGEPIYILPSSGIPATLPYLGLSSEHPTLAAYDELRITLVGMTGPAGGVFSLYSSSANVPINTLNSVFPAGSVTMDIGDHLHFNWAFSQLGVYDLTFQFEALGGDPVLTGTDVFRFDIIPEPTTAALMIVAFAGATLMRRRRVRMTGSSVSMDA